MPRKSKFTEEQIAYALKQTEAGVPVAEVCRKYGVSEQTYDVWRKKYRGLATSELARLRVLEAENKKLKALVADLSLDKHMLQEVIAKNSEARSAAGARRLAPRGVLGESAARMPTGGRNAKQRVRPPPPRPLRRLAHADE